MKRLENFADGAGLASAILGAKPVAQKDVSHFDWDIVAERMERVYQGVVG